VPIDKSKVVTVLGCVFAAAGYLVLRLTGAHIGGPELAALGAVLAALGDSLATPKGESK
jgi:hypothetical protein